jgi:predicted nucleic acid-binding protein
MWMPGWKKYAHNMDSVLLDTSFLIRLVNSHDSLHKQVGTYYKYFIDNKIEMYLSAIAVAEYSAKDDLKNLPLKSFKIIPFDYFDGQKAGEFHAVLLKNKGKLAGIERNLIKDDCKLIAQIYNRKIAGFVTKDKRAFGQIIKPIQTLFPFNLEFIDIALTVSEWRGELF